jgi:predicted aspartyl protease
VARKKLKTLDKGRALYLGAVSNSSGSEHVNIKILFVQKKVKVNARAMVDSGATGIFIDKDFCRKFGLTTYKRKRPIRLTLFDGSEAGVITHQAKGTIVIDGQEQDLIFEVTQLSTYPIVLGLPWLKMFNPTINWMEEEILFAGATDPSVSLEEQIPSELHQYLKVFSEEEARVLPPHRTWDCRIDLQPGKPYKKGKVYDLSHAELQAQDEWIREHLTKGYIRPSTSPISTSTFFVKKKDESGKMNNIRLVVDYRYLNSITIKNRYPIPLIGNLTDQLRNAKVFTKMDLRYGYHLVRIAEGDEWKTAFSTRHGQFEYTVMPLGLCNAPAVFQQMMNEIFYDLLDRGVVIYLDDILIYAENDEELTTLTLEVLSRLEANNLYVKPSKCAFKVPKVEFLGLIVFEGGLQMDPGKTDAVREWPAPRNIPDLQAFLGFCNFYRRFIQDFSSIARPMNYLLQKGVKWLWGPNQDTSFKQLKSQFESGPVLMHPDPEKPFFVECDASGYAMGGELSQEGEDGKRHPVAFFSKSMQPAERNYDIHDRELLAVIRCFQQWRHYLEGAKHQVVVRSDHHNLQYFRTTKVLTSRQVRWAEFLSGFDFVIVYQSGKESARTDALSRRVDHKPDDRPELVDRIFTDKHFLNAVSTVIYEDEAAILQGIRDITPYDDKVAPYITFIKESGKNLEDWSWDDKYLRRRGKIYVPGDPDLRQAVMYIHHDTRMGGHRGPKATLELISRKFYWPGMAKLADDYVAGCDVCQRVKIFTHAKYGPLEPLKTPDRKWTHISYDFITGLPKTEGKDAILVVVDRFSKGAHFIPCTTSETGESTARLFLDNVWKLHGTPEDAVSDRGVQFHNHFMKRLYELLDIHPSYSTAYHPESDGQTERVNQILENYLRNFVSYRQDDWVELLPLAEWSYNNHASNTTQQSPFSIWYGEHPQFYPGSAKEEIVPSAEEFASRIKESNKETKALIELAQAQYKDQADKDRVEEPQWEIGDKVWLNRKHIQTDRPTEKLDYRRLGPFEIIEKIGRRAYRLKLPSAMKIHDVFHVSLLEKVSPDNFNRQPIALPPVVIDNQEEYEVEKILNSCHKVCRKRPASAAFRPKRPCGA